MPRMTGSLCVFAFFATAAFCRESEGARRNSVLLNGAWEFVFGEGDERAETEDGAAKLAWRKITLPGPFMRWDQEVVNRTRYAWARRSFEVTAGQAAGLAVLRWNRIGTGAAAYINGRKVGENEPMGPYQVVLPAGVLKAGENRIVLKIRGAAGVRRSASGNPLVPSGFGPGLPEVTDDVWIDFADTAYMKWALALPDLARSRVRIRVTPMGPARVDDLQLTAAVTSWPDGKAVGEGSAQARGVPTADPLGGEHFFVEVPMPGFKAWTYEDRALYTARVRLAKEGRVLDELSFRFGMREIGVKDRRYTLNEKRLWLRGSNLVFEWDWGDTITGHEREYLAAEAREMSMNSFRTHTRPPPRLWADICDEEGTMILAEFPVLYNYADYKFTPEELEVWHRHCLTDAAGWMARLWNHPAVVMWVLSNESNRDDAWEEGPFQEFVNTLDPTRPTMRTGTTGTKENNDIHACGNVTDTAEGNLPPQVRGWFEAHGRRTTTCSEYMNDFGHPRTQWSGVDDSRANDLAVAQIGLEHTEAMRRARLDGILPYMYAGWTRTRQAARVRETGKGSAVWKAGFAAPASAAWHSALSPVLASLDLFDADYATGREVTTELHLINDSWHEAKVRVDLLLTRECPELIPEAKCFDSPVNVWHLDAVLGADTIEKRPVTWRLPDEEGCYWLTARLTGVSGRPVLSQRFVRAIAPRKASDVAAKRTYVVLGAGDTARAFFAARGLRAAAMPRELLPDLHVVVIWNATHLTREEKRHASALCDFADRGGRVLVLATPSWDWTDLCDVKIEHDPRFSRVFPHGDLARTPLAGIDREWLIRWNGLPGTVAYGCLEGAAMAHAERILWAREPKTVVMAAVPARTGKGRIVFSQLDLQGRADRRRPEYDTAAERVLCTLIEGAPGG